MDDFPGILARDFGFRPYGKAAPMAASNASSSGGGDANLGFGSGGSSCANGSLGKSRSGWNPNSASDHRVGISGDRSPPDYDDVFGAAAMPSNPSSHGRTAASSPPPAFDSIFDSYNKDAGAKLSSSSSLPVYDRPVYDDYIFDGVPGVKSSSSFKYNDIFASMSSGSNHVSSPPYEDLLEKLGKPKPVTESKGPSKRSWAEKKYDNLSGFDDLLPGFSDRSPPKTREFPDSSKQKPAVSSAKASTATEDPFVLLQSESPSTYSSSGKFSDLLGQINVPVNFRSTEIDVSTKTEIPGYNNAFNEISESEPFFTAETNEVIKDKFPLESVESSSVGNRQSSPSQSPVDAFDGILPKTQASNAQDSQKSWSVNAFDNSDTRGRNILDDQSPKVNNHPDTANDVWLTVDEIPLFTEPTNASPPSRKPPPLVLKEAPLSSTGTKRDNESSGQSSHNFGYHNESARNSAASPIDKLDDFPIGKPQIYVQDHSDKFVVEEEIETNSAAAAMKEAMDRAEAKFRHAKEVRERERDGKSSKSRDSMHQKDIRDADARSLWEKEQREQEYKEKERKRLEKEKEQELERARERNKQAVERAIREARERAAAEARLKAESAAVEKANVEARQRAERAAAQRAAAEARERAEKEARERAEKEAREKAKEKVAAEARGYAAELRDASESRQRAERAAVERAAAEARERAAAAAREKQKKPENDLESFFGMSARANSAPKQRSTSSETMFDSQAPNKGEFDGPKMRASGSNATVKKASLTTSFSDDPASIFGGPRSSGEFQEIEGESEERRRARLERHQRTLERAAKALAEKNERDMQTQREQAERHRIAENLDLEIKRWSSGKEGNLRALLSTLQYVLWPECGWQPVSLTDLITAAAVKKVYRKSTLCIHPDKVQQKGATIQQKYIAEKVFDLLKEAWNKFNSEELF